MLSTFIQSTPLKLDRKYVKILFEFQNVSNFQAFEPCSD